MFLDYKKRLHLCVGAAMSRVGMCHLNGWRYCLLLVQGQVNLDGDADSSTHHGVVTDAEEAHHLNVSRH